VRTLIFGLGNPILSDDGVGIRIAQELKSQLSVSGGRLSQTENRKPKTEIDIVEASIAGVSILDEIVGYDRLILIDSIKTEKGKPGDVYKMKLEDLSTESCGNVTSHLSSSHGTDFATTIELGKKLGYKIPEVVDIYAIEVENNTTFSERCTEKVERSIPRIVEQIMEENKREF